MRRFAIIACAVLAFTGAARALTSEAVDLRVGPAGGGDVLASVWMAKCPPGQRLVGLRLHGKEEVVAAEAICARLRQDGAALVWASVPTVPPEPEPPPPPRRITRVVSTAEVETQGTVLRADSMGVTRRRGSRAVVITITEPVKDEQVFPMPEPTLEFDGGGETRDLLCGQGQFVNGLRIGSKGDRVAALQLFCGDATGRTLATVGDWPTDPKPATKQSKKSKKKRDKAKAEAAALRVQRIECSRSGANPHDGIAASAVFGAAGNKRIANIGLSCAKLADPDAGRNALYVSAAHWLDNMPRRLGMSWTFDKPRWFDGAQLAVCAPGELARDCAQASADRYCAKVEGYDRALAYVVGRFAKESVAASGQRCPRGSCRAFATITCGFGEPPDPASPEQVVSAGPITASSRRN